MALAFVVSVLFNNVPAMAAVKTIIPKVAYVNAPKLEYTAGDVINFDLHTPNYGGKVQYRVVLWDNNKKLAKDLWTAGDRYYKNWMPYGNNVFNLHWIINEPGSYRITIYVKRAGLGNNKTFLKNFNCDSYMESVAFVVKPKVAAAKLFDKEGQTYGSTDAAKLEVIPANVKITANKVTLANAKIDGDLVVTGDNANIKNVTVTGKITLDPGKDGEALLEGVNAKSVEVLSGGQNTLTFNNVVTELLSANNSGITRILSKGTTKISQTLASSKVILELAGGSFGDTSIVKGKNGDPEVEFRGDFKNKITVKTTAILRTSTGSNVGGLFLDSENPQDNVRVYGSYGNIDILRSINLFVSAGANVDNIEARALSKITVDKQGLVNTLDTNNLNSQIVNNGTIVKVESSSGSSFPSTGGGPYIPSTVAVNGISLDATAVVISKSGNMAVSAIVSPMDATSKIVDWSSENESIAKVDSNGKITAVAVGTTRILATTRDGNKKAYVNVTITNEDITAKANKVQDNITFTITSSTNNDVVTLKLTDLQDNTKYIDQISLSGTSKTFTIPVTSGDFKCYIRGLNSQIIQFNI